MLKIVAVFVATIMVIQILADDQNVVDASRFEQQLENMQQQWLAEKKELKKEINKLQDEIKKQNQHNEVLQVDNKNFQHKVKKLFSKVMHENQNLRHLVEKSATQYRHDSVIGFSAYASVTHDYDDGDIVQFDTVITNKGGFYSDQTSTFTCISTGYYLFSVNVRSTNGNYMHAEIEIGGNTVASVLAHSDYDSASNTVIVSCPQGKQVYVRCTLDDNRMLGSLSGRVSMFTGILLYSA